MIRVLNLFSGLGGNRRLYPDYVSVTAVESDAEIADFYSGQFPNDKIVIGCANQYLEKNFMNFDFIWSSPPCQSHSQYRHNVGVLGKGFAPILPDASLYSQILFLETYFKGKWAVENVRPYYTYLKEPTVMLDRHPIWSNFEIEPMEKSVKKEAIRTNNKISQMANVHGFDITQTKIKNKRQALRNCANSEMGLHILKCSGLLII